MKRMHRVRWVLVTAGLAVLTAGPGLAQAATQPVGDGPRAAVTAVSPEQEKQAQAAFEAGRELYFQGQYQSAIGKLAQAVAAHPGKTSYKLMLAKAYRAGGQAREALAMLQAVVKDNPEHVEAAVELSELLDPAKEPDRVIATLEPLLKFKHDYPLYHLLASAHYQKEQLDKARGYFEEAVRLNPKSAVDHEQLANIYLAQKRFAKAAGAYETAGQLGADSPVYHFKLASAYFNLRNYLGTLTTAQVLGGQVGQIKDQYLLIDPVPGQKDLFTVAGPKSAAFQVVKAQLLGVTVPQIKFMEANIWLSARRYARADEIYRGLEGKLDKGDVGLFWFYWSQVALGLGDLDQYLSRLDKAIAAEPEVYKPTRADALVTVANRHLQRGDHKRYIEYLSHAVAANPLAASLHLTLGDALWQAGERARSIEQYTLVLELEPDHAQRVRLLNRIRADTEAPAATRPDR